MTQLSDLAFLGYRSRLTHQKSKIKNHKSKMANEELIYRITRAIYERLGASADESAVEQLVTDIYRTVEPELARNGASPASAPSSASIGATASEGSADRLIKIGRAHV